MYSLNMLGLTFGSDPEFFVYSTERKRIVSPHELTVGTKEQPEKIPSFNLRDWSAQVDGFALEFNTPVYLSSRALQWDVQRLLPSLEEFFTNRWLDLGNKGTLKFSRKVAHIIHKEEFDSAPASSKQLGCSPDFDAFKGEQNPSPKLPHPRFRTVAGHITIGWESYLKDLFDKDIHFEVCRKIIKDIETSRNGTDKMTFKGNTKQEDKRRVLYGKSGAFRPTPFGVEWRTPSNAWCFPGSTIKLADFFR